jgi:DNA replication protein DnaC
MRSLAFVRDAEDLVFYGQTGRGKTQMATALGIAATSAGYPVRFWQTAQLVLQLGKAKREGTLDRLLADVAKARLLVLDEFGYVPFDVDGARLLYQVISESHERRSVISATNVESGRRGTDFADKRLATAIVDRVAHHGRLVEFGGVEPQARGVVHAREGGEETAAGELARATAHLAQGEIRIGAEPADAR